MRIENIDMRFELLYRKVNLLPKSNNHFVNVPILFWTKRRTVPITLASGANVGIWDIFVRI